MKKIKRKIKIQRKFKFRGEAAHYILFLLAAGFLFAFAMVGSEPPKLSPTASKVVQTPTYSCCDSGDGVNCRPNPAKKIMYKGIKSATQEEYHLLKTNVFLRSQDHHVDPDKAGQRTPDGELIFYNPRSEANEKDWKPECFSNKNSPGKQKYGYDDFLFGPGARGLNKDNKNFPDLGCYAIPNEQLIYVCKKDNPPGECEKKQNGHARFDVYYRASDFAATGNAGIHDIIKNCVRPTVVPTGGSGQQLAGLPSPSGKPNLQLETFGIVDSPPLIDWISPYCKPAIYLYPERKSSIQVKVLSEQRLTYTIPSYPAAGWKVQASPNGDIVADKEQYDYLYYETEVPSEKIALAEEGFVVSYGELPLFIPQLVKQLGLNDKETVQFSDYWVGVLPEAAYYRIKIVEEKHLDELAKLMIVPQPKTIIRVTLHFEPLDEKVNIKEPTITSKKRDGFTVVEWGGIYKRDKDRPFSCFM